MFFLKKLTAKWQQAAKPKSRIEEFDRFLAHLLTFSAPNNMVRTYVLPDKSKVHRKQQMDCYILSWKDVPFSCVWPVKRKNGIARKLRRFPKQYLTSFYKCIPKTFLFWYCFQFIFLMPMSCNNPSVPLHLFLSVPTARPQCPGTV